jgi:hypothetical protein
MYMGAILSASFLAVSYLAHRLHVIPVADESKSVLGQIGQAVYGNGLLGHALFLILQISTTAILILAANTSFADFPRLASFHAGDAFMPRQLTKRGHKLVFSNGIIALALAASLVIVAFRASVTSMIPLYALGVFTSFTLSQSGMAKRHLRIKEPGWRLGLAINGFGAICTAVVAVIIAIVKFHPPGQFGGAWLVLLFVPVMVFVLTRVNKTYEHEEEDLLAGLEHVQRPLPQRHVAVVLCDDLDEKTLHAIQYAHTIQPEEIRVVHLARDPALTAALHERWAAAELGLVLEDVPCASGRRGECLRSYLRKCGGPSGDVHVTVIVPGPARMSLWQRLRRGRAWSGLVDPLRTVEGASVVVVRDHGGPGHHAVAGRMQVSPRTRHVAIILVDRLDRSVLKAIRYARMIDATDIRAVHAAVDPHAAGDLAEQWADLGNVLGVPLDVEECFDRNIARTVTKYVHRVEAPNAEVTVVLPRREYPRFLQRLLHDHTSRAITRALAQEPHVDVVVVPYRLGAAGASPAKPRHSSTTPAADQAVR